MNCALYEQADRVAMGSPIGLLQQTSFDTKKTLSAKQNADETTPADFLATINRAHYYRSSQPGHSFLPWYSASRIEAKKVYDTCWHLSIMTLSELQARSSYRLCLTGHKNCPRLLGRGKSTKDIMCTSEEVLTTPKRPEKNVH